jgi:hypothetical protein
MTDSPAADVYITIRRWKTIHAHTPNSPKHYSIGEALKFFIKGKLSKSKINNYTTAFIQQAMCSQQTSQGRKIVHHLCEFVW